MKVGNNPVVQEMKKQSVTESAPPCQAHPTVHLSSGEDPLPLLPETYCNNNSHVSPSALAASDATMQ